MNYQKIFLLLFLCISYFNFAYSQISGFVKDNAGKPLSDVQVKWENSSVGSITDGNGKYSIKLFQNSNKLIFSKLYFETDTIQMDTTLVSEQNINLTEIKRLNEVEITSRSLGVIKNRISALNVETITTTELKKAPCCNLSESFETNASVDVAYDDAVTGAKQIKLLGLSGKYVQILTENSPNLRGLSSVYGLDFVPGPWMESIQVSKGTASVKNGYEAIAGQINVEYKKPKTSEPLAVNVYVNNLGRTEANITSGIKLNENLYTGIMLHASDEMIKQDENNDGFIDMPMVKQYNIANRWHYTKNNYIMQVMVKAVSENREGGKLDHSYKIGVNTNRYEFFLKNGIVFEHQHLENEIKHTECFSSLGIILSGSIHNQNANFGFKNYQGRQNNLYANVIYDINFEEKHKISLGTSFNLDEYNEMLKINDAENFFRSEITPGIFGEYTFTKDKITAMTGLRVDYNSQYGLFITPRVHVRYALKDFAHLRFSLGRGFRTPNVLAENNYYLASSRKMIIENNQQQVEDGWNYGITMHNIIPIGKKEISLKTEWFYTDFQHQIVTDLDSNPHEVHFTNLMGKSFSNSIQIEVNMEIIKNLNFTAAHRINNVKTTINGELREKPLTNRSKSLLNLSYLTKLKKWQLDFTTQFNGGGRLPDPDSANPQWESEFKPFTILNGQITKNFKRWSLYCGVENITGFMQKNPIIDVQNPFSSNFDASMIWGPMHGRTLYVGLRWKTD